MERLRSLAADSVATLIFRLHVVHHIFFLYLTWGSLDSGNAYLVILGTASFGQRLMKVRFLSHCFCPPAVLDEVDPSSPKHHKRSATSPGVAVLSGCPTMGNSGEGTSVVQNDDKRLRLSRSIFHQIQGRDLLAYHQPPEYQQRRSPNVPTPVVNQEGEVMDCKGMHMPMEHHGIAKWVLVGGGDNRLRLGCLVTAGIDRVWGRV
nr:hypothetical protein [Tanacetum cinerariifolium]